MKVFLVDDENEVRPRLARVLSEIPGMLVHSVAPRGGNVLRQLVRFQPDAAIVDMRLRGGGALDLIRTIKALPRPPVVVALSSSHFPAYSSFCRKAGAELFFDKVHEQDRLLEALTQLQEELRREGHDTVGEK
jgi:DNA-binding NarL/FixJ family response regulator